MGSGVNVNFIESLRRRWRKAMSKYQTCVNCNCNFVGPDSNVGSNSCDECVNELHEGSKFEDPNLNSAIYVMLPQLLMVLIQRFAAGTVHVPVEELDTVPVGKVMIMEQHGDELVLRIVDKPTDGGAKIEETIRKLIRDLSCRHYWVYHMSGPYECRLHPEE